MRDLIYNLKFKKGAVLVRAYSIDNLTETKIEEIQVEIRCEASRLGSMVSRAVFLGESHGRIIDLLSSDVWRRLRSVRPLSFQAISSQRKSQAKEENYISRPHHS